MPPSPLPPLAPLKRPNPQGGWQLPSLQRWRLRADLSVAELARRAHVSPITIRHIERGAIARYSTAEVLAHALDVSVRSLAQSSKLRVVGGRAARITLERQAALDMAMRAYEAEMTHWRQFATTPTINGAKTREALQRLHRFDTGASPLL